MSYEWDKRAGNIGRHKHFTADVLDEDSGQPSIPEEVDLSGYQLESEKDQASGYAGLDSGGKLLAAQLPGAAATDVETAAAVAALSAVYQPLDSDLTAIAALTTTSTGRSLLAAADASALQTILGLSTFIKTLVDDTDAATARATLVVNKRPVSVSIGDPNGSVLVAGVKAIVRVPFAWTDIESASIVGDASGSIIFTVRKATWNVAPSWSSIVSSAPPTLSGAVAVTDATLTGWTKSGSAGDLLEIGVSGTPSTVKLASLTLVLVQ